MKKILLGFILSVCAMIFIINNAQAYSEMGDRLKGRILLQVEENGEAWYIYPNDYRRYYLGRPLDAWNIMRFLGLGITNSDLAKIPTDGVAWDGEANLINRLKGQILLQVEEHGEAWYLSPVNGKRYYMGRPDDAFAIMRFLGLGIKTADLFTIEPNIEISYIHYNGTLPYEPDEYVEIRNYGKIPQNLNQWIISDLKLKNIYQLNQDVTLNSYQNMRIYTNQGEYTFGSKLPLWDQNDIVMLINSNDTLIDIYLNNLLLL